jgi:hypothetical protein
VMRPIVESIRAQGFQRHCWQQVALHAVALIETGDAPPAAVHEAVRLMRGAGAMDWMASHLALWLTQRGQAADAARLLGWSARRQRESGRAPDAPSLAAQQRARRAIDACAAPSSVQAWQAEGERWLDDDVATLLLGVA